MGRKKKEIENERAEAGSGERHDKHAEKEEGVKHDKHAPKEIAEVATSENADD